MTGMMERRSGCLVDGDVGSGMDRRVGEWWFWQVTRNLEIIL